jgi:hypothetical protein
MAPGVRGAPGIALHTRSFGRGLWPRPVDCCIWGGMTVRAPVIAHLSLCLAASAFAHGVLDRPSASAVSHPDGSPSATMTGLAPDIPTSLADPRSPFAPDP